MSIFVTVLWWIAVAGAVLAFIGMMPGFYEIGRAASGVPVTAAVTSANDSPQPTTIIFGIAVLAALSAAAYFAFGQLQGDVTNYVWPVVATLVILVAAVLGTALFFTGLTARSGLSANLAFAGFMAATVAVMWPLFGYSIEMTEGVKFIGGFARAFLHDAGDDLVINGSQGTFKIPEMDIVLLHTATAVLATALVTSPFANRIRTSFLLAFGMLWVILIYAPIAHWVWAPDGWLSNSEAGLVTLLDGAGGSVIYLNAGLAALTCAFYVGPDRRETRGGISCLISGALILWLGVFASNISIAATSGADLGTVVLTNILASFAAVLAWPLVEWATSGRTTTWGFGFSLFAGVAAGAAGSGIVSPLQGLVIGLAAGALSSLSVSLWTRQFGSSSACLIYAVGGLAGVLLTGLFGLTGGPTEIWRQCLGAATVGIYDVVGSLVILKVADWVVGTGVQVEDEEIDISRSGTLAID